MLSSLGRHLLQLCLQSGVHEITRLLPNFDPNLWNEIALAEVGVVERFCPYVETSWRVGTERKKTKSNRCTKCVVDVAHPGGSLSDFLVLKS
jgi:hypothetical protein